MERQGQAVKGLGGRQRRFADARLRSPGEGCGLVGPDLILPSCFEAGRDGFWLHRLLTDNGVVNPVVEPTSILVTRGARRAKTDRLVLRAFCASWRRRSLEIARSVAWSGRRASARRTTNGLIASANISFRSHSFLLMSFQRLRQPQDARNRKS
jgi:hypothetical protein